MVFPCILYNAISLRKKRIYIYFFSYKILAGFYWVSLIINCKSTCISPGHFCLYSLFKNFYCYSITVVCIFSPSFYPTPAKPTSLPHFHLPPWFSPCVLYSTSWKPLSPLSAPHSPLAIVRLFLTLTSLVIFCLLFSFVD